MAKKTLSGARRHRDLEIHSPQRSADQAMSPVLRLLGERAEDGADLEASRLGLLMLWLADDIIRAVNKQLEAFDISEKKLDVLMIFAAQVGLDADSMERRPEGMLQTPTGIAEYFGITRATATGLLDWLEKRNLVERTRHPTDRRSTPIEITPAGRHLVDEAVPTFLQACTGLAASLTERDRKDLSRVLDKVWSQLKAQAED